MTYDIDRRPATIWSEGSRLAAEVFKPVGAAGPRPAILLCHGWGGLKEHLAERYATPFTKAGFVCLVFDYRGWGGSDGRLISAQDTPPLLEAGERTVKARVLRENVDPVDQVADIRACLAWLLTEDGVDPARVGLWGSSYGGGHVVFVAGTDARVKAVVAQIGGYGFPDNPDAIAAARRQEADKARAAIDPPVPQGVSTVGGLRGTPDMARQVRHAPVVAAAGIRVPTLFLDAEFEEYNTPDLQGGAVYDIVKQKAIAERHTFPCTHYKVYDAFYGPSLKLALDWFEVISEMQELKGKVAVVTGGASGIGLAMARAFAAQGMKLVLADVQQDALDRATAGLKADGHPAIGVRTDVSKYADVEALAVPREAFGGVHVVVNNAGVSITGPTWKMSLDDWRWVYDVNVWGVIHGVKAFTPMLVEQGEPAHIVNTASLAAFNGTGEHAPYCSSKAAVLSISQALRSELIAADTRIGVSVVCPGMVATDIHRSWRNRPQGDQAWSDREWNDPQHRAGSDAFQGRGVSPESIAELTLEAIREDRFYVFNGEFWPAFIERSLRPILTAQNPPVVTWGPDLRPAPDKTTETYI